jgi:hypothetical protein
MYVKTLPSIAGESHSIREVIDDRTKQAAITSLSEYKV